MMYKFCEKNADGIDLMLFTGTINPDDLTTPLKGTLTAKVLGIRDGKYVGGVFEDTKHVRITAPGACNLMTSKDGFTAQYQGASYSGELTFSSIATYRIKAGAVRTMAAMFTVKRDDKEECPDELLEAILAHFPDEEYEPLPERPDLR